MENKQNLMILGNRQVSFQQLGNIAKSVLRTIEEYPVASAIIGGTTFILVNTFLEHKYIIKCNKATGLYFGPSASVESI